MRFSTLWPVTGLLLLCCGQANAAQDQNNVFIYREKPTSYVGASVIRPSIDIKGGDTANLFGGAVRIGGLASDYWGVEFRLGAGISDRTFHQSSGGISAMENYNLQYLGAAYLTGRLPLFEMPLAGRVYGQAFLGASTESITTHVKVCSGGTCNRNTQSNDEQSFSWGVGLGIQPMAHWSAQLDYMSYTSVNYLDLTSIEGTIRYHF